jgi:hypothetical protein
VSKRLLVCALVAAMAAAGCGGDESGGKEEVVSCYAEPEQSVLLRALPVADIEVTEEAVRATAERICARQISGVQAHADGTEIQLGSRERPPMAELLAAAAPGRVAFYDWEANVYGSPDKPVASMYDAASRAAELTPREEPEEVDFPSDAENDVEGDKYFLFGGEVRGERRLIRPGAAVVGDRAAAALRRDYFTSCAEIAADVRSAQAGLDPKRTGRPAPDTQCPGALGVGKVEKGSTVVKVPRGIAVLADEEARGWWVVEDDAEITGSEIRNPEQQLDPLTNEPIVTFEFNADGREAFARMTLRIVARAVRADRAQRFAIVLDDRVMSLAQIDHVANPQGLDGSAGAALTGVGDLDESKQLARTLDVGPLPLDLQVVRGP